MIKETQPKFKKGDKVMILNELTNSYIVQNVFFEKRINIWASGYKGVDLRYEVELVVINNKVYEANDIIFYSLPIEKLANKIKELENKLENKEIKWYKKLCFF